jgi:predicted Fe-Mo cluster-binding NifX family protein
MEIKEKMLVAIATDNGEKFIDRHFGDVKFYNIYEIDPNKSIFIKKIDNSTEEEDEEIHADPKKAKGISNLLLKENVKIVVSKVFGPNIKRIKKKFVCIVSNDKTIGKSLSRICENFEIIKNEWEKGAERKHLTL